MTRSSGPTPCPKPNALDVAGSGIVEVGGVALYVLHDVKTLDLDPVAAGFRAVISGHSHQPAIAERQGILFLNPGSAGPRRFKLPISVARLIVRGDTIDAQLVELAV